MSVKAMMPSSTSVASRLTRQGAGKAAGKVLALLFCCAVLVAAIYGMILFYVPHLGAIGSSGNGQYIVYSRRLACQARFEYSDGIIWNNGDSDVWFTSTMDIYVKNLGDTTIPAGWTFSIHNPAYTNCRNMRNFQLTGVQDGTFIGRANMEHQVLQPRGASEQSLGLVLSAASTDSFVPASFAINGVECSIVPPRPQARLAKGSPRCQARFVISEAWTSGMGHLPCIRSPHRHTASMNVFVKNLHGEAIPGGWTFQLHNPGYVKQNGTWNFDLVNFEDHTFIGTVKKDWPALVAGGPELNFGLILASSSRFLPTMFTVNGQVCKITGVDSADVLDGTLDDNDYQRGQ